MRKYRTVLITLLVLSFISCEHSKEREIKTNRPFTKASFNDSTYVLDFSYKIGDVRRYGVFPNREISPLKIERILELAQKGVLIQFPKGYYNTNILLKGLNNITLQFNDAILSGGFQIIDLNDKPSKQIMIMGKLTVLDKVFIRRSKDIMFDELVICSDTINSFYHKKNRGLSIYAGSKNLHFKSVKIYNTGGSRDSFYKYVASALQIHGWDDNPENMIIDNLIIENAARTAVYLTGKNHHIKKAQILNFGEGDNKNMFGLEDAKPGTEKEFAGFWINKCNNCDIDSLQISNTSKQPYSLKFGIGTYSTPAVINNLSLKGETKHAPIEADILTNVLVKHEY